MHRDVALRPYRSADAAQVVDVINADAERTLGHQRAIVDGAGHVRLIRYVPPASQKVVAVNAHNEIVGYAYLATRDHAIANEVGGAVHPRSWGQGIGTRLLAWAEQRAYALVERAPVGVKTVLQSTVFETEQTAIRLLTKQGFRRTRAWVHLRIHLDAPPAVPAVPDDMLIRELDVENDWERVEPAMDEAYADHWGTISLPSSDTPSSDEEPPDGDQPQDLSYSNSPGYCFVLMDGESVVGSVFCNAKLVEREDAGRVGSMFVRPQYRRRGLGRALLLTAFRAFWDHGVRHIILDTDATSLTHAPRFYMSMGMRPYRHELVYEKELRPGKEVRRVSL